MATRHRSTGSVAAVLGISHRTAPTAVREKASLTEDAARALLRDLVSASATREAVAVCTCNRTEVYVAADQLTPALDAARSAILAHTRISIAELERSSYALAGDATVHHLFRVAASLDSAVVGEPEIQGQLRTALALARAENATGPVLDVLFRHALIAGKRVRRYTGIGRGAVSLPSVAIALARATMGNLAGHRALVLGSGEMARKTATALRAQGAAEIVVAGRTRASVRALADRVGGRAVALAAVGRELEQTDIVIASTGAPAHLLSAPHVAPRRSRLLVLVDLAVPRNVDPGLRRCPGVVLFDMDALVAAANRNRVERAAEARRAEQLVAAEVERFLAQAHLTSPAAAPLAPAA